MIFFIFHTKTEAANRDGWVSGKSMGAHLAPWILGAFAIGAALLAVMVIFFPAG